MGVQRLVRPQYRTHVTGPSPPATFANRTNRSWLTPPADRNRCSWPRAKKRTRTKKSYGSSDTSCQAQVEQQLSPAAVKRRIDCLLKIARLFDGHASRMNAVTCDMCDVLPPRLSPVAILMRRTKDVVLSTRTDCHVCASGVLVNQSIADLSEV